MYFLYKNINNNNNVGLFSFESNRIFVCVQLSTSFTCHNLRIKLIFN